MESLDVAPYIKSKSDQINGDDLLGGPITVQIRRVRIKAGEQPVTIEISGGHMPLKPSKTVLRVLVAAWGTTDASEWVGRWITLYRDAHVKWAGVEVGGIRVSAVSHIDRAMTLQLTETRGTKKPWKIAAIKDPKQSGAATANLDALLSEVELTRADVDRWLATEGKPSLDAAPDKVPALAAWLAANPDRIDAIRALVPAATTDADPSDTDDQE